jgi:hypothetical protein
MDPLLILDALSPFQFEREIIVKGEQRTDDIIIQVLRAHLRCKKDYDLITRFFEGGSVPKKLFDFCKKQLNYNEEPGADQTTRSPAGILELSETVGVDCKHYAGWIAGVLDALNRRGHDFKWKYRFVSYTQKRKADHVYVILNDDLWLDPTPLKAKDGTYYKRNFNDRYAIPVWILDLKPDEMLSHLSGVHYEVTEDSQKNGCMGRGKGDSVNGLLDAALGAASGVASLLPDGGLKNFLTSIVSNPTGAILNLIKGKKYTSGNYALGEMYMRNILGMSQIQKRGDVGDEYVPQAWQFFTLALGIEIGANDHLDRLYESAQSYINYMSPQIGAQNINPEAVQRAHDILRLLNYGPAIRDVAWPLRTFGAIPYVYPIPDVEPGSFYSGYHPITNIPLNNGYPVNQPGKPVSTTTTENTPGTQTVTNVSSETPGTTQAPGGAPPPAGTEMDTTTKVILGVLGVGAVVGIGYALSKKK